MFKFSKSKNIDFSQLFHQNDTIYDHLPIVKKKRARRRRLRRLKIAAYIIVFAGMVILVLAIPFIYAGRHIYSEVSQGKYKLEQAAAFVEMRQFEQAIGNAGAAESYFDASLEELRGLKSNFVSRIGLVNAQLEDIGGLITSAKMLSQGIGQGSRFADSLYGLIDKKPTTLTFNTFSQEEKTRLLKRIYESSPDLENLGNTLSQSYASLAGMHKYSLLWPFNAKIEELRQQLKDTSRMVREAAPLARAMPVLMGYPDKATYLVILENSDELRPTGGFIGTFGVLTVDLGDITSFSTHDVYHLDMPVKDLVTAVPPAPLKEYLGVEKWYLRDANWSPDWPEAAKTIEAMYFDELDKLKTVRSKDQDTDLVLASAPADGIDGVIAFTPEFFTDLLKITGAITLDGVAYTEDNFTDLLEYKVEQEYIELGTPAWQRKEVIGRVAEELKIRLLDMPLPRWSEILNTIIDNAHEKNVLIYSKDKKIENILDQSGLSGKFANREGDFLGVVDANLAALKTDAVMDRSVSYAVEQGPNGLFADLSVNYSHLGGFDWKTTRYRSYTRVYAPLGSELVEANGFEADSLEVASELGLTVFGGFITVEPGKIGTLEIKYKLPERLDEQALADGYSLYLQKQPGSRVSSLTVDTHLLGRIENYQTAGFFAERLSPSEIRWTDNLKTDKVFKAEIGS